MRAPADCNNNKVCFPGGRDVFCCWNDLPGVARQFLDSDVRQRVVGHETILSPPWSLSP